MTVKGGDQDARLQLALTWTRSSFCAHGDCVEVRYADGAVEVRDSKLDKDSPVQRWTPEEWKNLLYAVGNLYSHPGVLLVGNDKIRLGVPSRHEFLWYDLYTEWVPFRRGVRAAEFDVDKLTARSLAAVAGTAGSTSPGSGHEAAAGVPTLEGDELPAPAAAESEDVPAGRVSPMVESPDPATTRPGRSGPIPAARVWALAEEPDRDVYQVLDVEGYTWLRQVSSDGPDFDSWHPSDEPEHCIPWLDLLIDYGPLTEVIDESAE